MPRKPAKPLLDLSDPINANLSGCWLFGDSPSGVAIDIGPFGNHATLHNTTLSDSHDGGQATSFNGTTSFAQSSVDCTINSATTVALSFWLKWTSFANNDALAFEYTANYNTSAGFIVDPNSSSPVSGTFEFGSSQGNSTNYYIGHFARPSAGVWHHYVLNMPRITTIPLEAYVDGIKQTVTIDKQNTPNIPGARSTLNFMCRNGASLFGAGQLDCVRLRIAESFTADEAARLHAEPYAGILDSMPRMRIGVPPAVIGTSSYVFVNT